MFKASFRSTIAGDNGGKVADKSAEGDAAKTGKASIDARTNTPRADLGEPEKPHIQLLTDGNLRFDMNDV